MQILGKILSHFISFSSLMHTFNYQEEVENKPCSWNEHIMWGINYLSDISKKYWNEVLSLEAQQKS